MRHVGKGNDWTTILNALNALASVAPRQPGNIEQAALRTGETWVERISKERWTAQNRLAIASAVIGVGAILYGARKLLAHDKSEGRMR
ncbi:MAG: hypothetical protein ACREFR_04290 [Limisphaerales bacterium]